MFGRAIPSDAIGNLFDQYFRVDVPGANVRQDFYPTLWQRPSNQGPRERRATLTAAGKTFSSSQLVKDHVIEFDCLHPKWSPRYGSELRWANVVKIDDWSFRDLAATVFPNSRTGAFLPRLGVGLEHTFSTTEGIVICPHYKNISRHWELPDGATAIGEWLKRSGVANLASDAGRATEQIVQTLGGFGRVGDIAKEHILKTLDEMSRRPITRSAHHQKFRNEIERAVKGDIWGMRSFETLVKRNAVELGLEVRCDKCSSWSWFALNQLGYKLQCALCLRETAFPIVDPGKTDNARWAYRVVGPFALPDYAKGGYASALAIRCFSVIIGGHRQAHTTWAAGRELTLSSEQKVECDFVLWYQRRSPSDSGQDSVTDIVFGEAKSFGKDAFKSNDVSNMKSVAQRFPGAILVFATTKQPDHLSDEEITAIRKLALWGREYVPGEWRSRAPVVLLTGIELFSGHSLEQTWKERGGRHAEFGEAHWLWNHSLRTLADITQQLYLGLPSYSQWHRAKWDAIHARRKARTEAKRQQQAPGGRVQGV